MLIVFGKYIYLFSFKAKIFSDIDPVENLLIGDENDAHKRRGHAVENRVDDDEPILGGIDDDFEIPCTAQTAAPFFSQNGNEYMPTQQTDLLKEHEGGESLTGMMHGDNLTAEMQQFDADNLVEAPLQVNAINIEYAKTSKNIDVRRLKQVIWALLREDNDKVMHFYTSRFLGN